jgi:hypothetical protein
MISQVTADTKEIVVQHGPSFMACLATVLSVVVLGAGARVLPAAEPSPAPAAKVADQLKALNDQTIIQSSVWLDTEWDQYKHGAEEATWTLRFVGVAH